MTVTERVDKIINGPNISRKEFDDSYHYVMRMTNRMVKVENLYKKGLTKSWGNQNLTYLNLMRNNKS